MMKNNLTDNELQVAIRPIRSGDELVVQEIFDGMSMESRFHRFLQAMPKLTPGMRGLLADVDGARHRAWAAYVGDRPVGIVRLIVDQTGDHELSVAVIDAMHRRGIGRMLVGVALAAAEADGLESVAVIVHPENAASISMFRRIGTRFRYEFGILVGRVPVHVPAGRVAVAA